MHRYRVLLLAIAVLAARPARADCELLYAPPAVRARLLAFHYANETRRERERAAAAQPARRAKVHPVRPTHALKPPPSPPRGAG